MNNKAFNYQGNGFNNKSNKKYSKIYTIIIVILLIVIFGIIGIAYYKNIKYKNSYEYVEDRLEEEAKKYVASNNLFSGNEFYIEAKKLNVELKDGCYSTSGVFVEKNNYQAYLICNDYETKINDSDNQYIKLNGRNIVFLDKDMQYNEAYYETLNDVSVSIESNVKNEEGVYNVIYNILKNNVIVDRVIKKVIVLDNKEINNFYPRILLVGKNIEYVELNSEYIENGVNSFDAIDGIVNNIKTNGKVDTSKTGEYILNYTAINSQGYASTVTRKIIVVNSKTDVYVNTLISPLDFTNENAVISLDVIGNSFDYIILPNGEKLLSNKIQYEVNENGKYVFKIYTKTGHSKEEEVEIKNIDRDKPNGVCNGYYIDNKSYITIDANDATSGIFKYVIDKKDYNSNAITLDGEIKNVNITVYDKANNTNEFSCELEDKNPITSACNDKTIYPGHKYVMTENQKKKLAAIVSLEADGHPRKAEDYLGMKLVASHMCNYYEKLKKGKEWTGEGLHHLITTSAWYSENTRSGKFDPNNERHHLSLKAVEEVMEKGNRILPHYIDEFDAFPRDVKNPLSDIEAYERDKTIYYGINWIKVTFWCINTPNGKSGNIFGYTKKPSEYN